ncbi:hypothetical protein HZB01_03730 [Candidatus Woesearchaeota archaeon]|nr:hypothetical protein [Candidatus Woesearchaeota archaeon]
MAEQKHDAAGNWNQQLWTFVVLGLLIGATLGFVIGSRGSAEGKAFMYKASSDSNPFGGNAIPVKGGNWMNPDDYTGMKLPSMMSECETDSCKCKTSCYNECADEKGFAPFSCLNPCFRRKGC